MVGGAGFRVGCRVIGAFEGLFLSLRAGPSAQSSPKSSTGLDRGFGMFGFGS